MPKTKTGAWGWDDGDEPLAAFPAEVLAEKGRTELSLYGCFEWKKIVVPDAIAKLTNLRELAIGMARVEALPESLGRLTKLETLSLNYAEELRSLPKSLGKLRSLTQLHLSYALKLKALPDSVGQLAKLEELTADPSGLKTVPASITKLTNLKTLTLPETVTKLPPGISNLQKLETLAIGPRALASIAGELPKMKNLRSLRVWGKSKTVPDTLGELSGLRELSLLYMEDLKSLPASIARLKELRRLDVSGNALTELASVVCALPKLTELDYDDNKLPLKERRLVEKLMKLPFAKRRVAAGVPAEAAKGGAKPVHLGEVASVNGYLAMLLVDGRLASEWRGVGNDAEDPKSDWARFGKRVGNRVAAEMTVGRGAGLGVALAIGQGIAHVYRTGRGLTIVEAFVEDEKDPLFLEYVASPPEKAKKVGAVAVPSGVLAMTPSTDDCADVPKKLARVKPNRGTPCGPDDGGLLVALARGRYDVLVESEVERSWGSGRRALLEPSARVSPSRRR